jgi:hypothetical protein
VGVFVTKALLAAGAAAMLAMSAPIAGATTFVVGGTNGVGGKPSQGEMQGLVRDALKALRARTPASAG